MMKDFLVHASVTDSFSMMDMMVKSNFRPVAADSDYFSFVKLMLCMQLIFSNINKFTCWVTGLKNSKATANNNIPLLDTDSFRQWSPTCHQH